MSNAVHSNPNPPLTGQVAVVTGASGGIGRAIALELANGGAAVVVHGNRHVQRAEQVAAEIRGLGGQATVTLADLGEPAAAGEFAAEAWSWRGGVDIWVNSAGADVLTGEAADWPFEQKLAALWQVDVQATMQLSRPSASGCEPSERAA